MAIEDLKDRVRYAGFRISYFFRTIVSKIKNIRFTKIHVKYWLLNMWMYTCFFFKGAVALLTLGLIDPDITSNSSAKVARQLSRVRDFQNGIEPEPELNDDDIEQKLKALRSDKSDPWRYQ